MSYQKPKVLAESKTNTPYSMACMVREGYALKCKPWFLLKKNLCSDNDILIIITVS